MVETTRDLVKNRSAFRRLIKENAELYSLILPGFIMIFLFSYLPLYGLPIAFEDYSAAAGVFGPDVKFVGLRHFARFLDGPFFFRLLGNTFRLSFFSFIFGFWPPIALALLLNEIKNMRFRKFVQTASYMPYFISMVVVAGMVLSFIDDEGFITKFCQQLGGTSKDLSLNPKAFTTVYVSTTVWKSFGFNSVLYLSTLSGVDQEQYEAARIDGANRWQQLWHISIPGILPVIAIQLIMQLGRLLSASTDTIILLYNSAVYSTADTFGTYVYRDGIQGGNYDFSTAVGLFTNVVNITLVILANTISRKVLDYSLW